MSLKVSNKNRKKTTAAISHEPKIVPPVSCDDSGCHVRLDLVLFGALVAVSFLFLVI